MNGRNRGINRRSLSMKCDRETGSDRFKTADRDESGSRTFLFPQLPYICMMTDARTFLDGFKKTRDFNTAFPLLLDDADFRAALFAEVGAADYPYPEYASWIAQHFFEKYPQLLGEWTPQFREVLFTTTNHTVQRNLLHILANVKQPLEDDGELLELLFTLLAAPETLVAGKVNAFRAIEQQYLKAYPELVSELQLIFELHREDDRPSLRAIIRYFHKRYRKQLTI